MPEKVKHFSEPNLRLQGQKLQLKTRSVTDNSASAKNHMLTHPNARSASVVPILNIYEKETSGNVSRRPYSADCILDFDPETPVSECSEIDSLEDQSLPSSELLKTLLSEPISSWTPKEDIKTDLKNKDYLSNREMISNEKESLEKTYLVPGLKEKPPLPKSSNRRSDRTPKQNTPVEESITNKTDFQKADEDLIKRTIEPYSDDIKSKALASYIGVNDTEVPKLNLQEEDNRDVMLQNWMLEGEEEVEKGVIDTERQTDIYLEKLKKEQKKIQPSISKNTGSVTTQPKFTAVPVKPPKDSEKTVSEVESWMSQMDNKESLSDRSSSKANYSDLLSNVEELEATTSTLLGSTEQKSDDDLSEKRNLGECNTYDEIVAILKVLEDEDEKSHKTMETIKDIVESELSEERRKTNSSEVQNININKERSHESEERKCEASSVSPNLSELLTFLDEVDRKSSNIISVAKERVEYATQLFNTSVFKWDSIPKLEELRSLSNEELARYIIDLSLRLKDKSSSINLLQNELSAMREEIMKNTKHSDQIVKEKLKAQKKECEETVKRHQKFIDQLIADKKTLNQQCESLITEMRVIEDRYNSNIKVLEQRHHIELQKAKEMCVAGERIKRERWIDTKAQKIKEMTAKCFEPELEAMSQRHQQELADLRSLHKREIEDLELKAARKTQQQCEVLRQQLTEEHEKAIAHERELMRIRYEQMVEVEEKNYQEQRRRLNNEHAKRLADCEEREKLMTAEKDRAIKQAQEEMEEKIQVLIRRHNSELKLMKETSELELEAWKNNYKKQQAVQLAEKELAIKEQFRKERDKEIENVIERLEMEATETKLQLEQTAENRIRRLKEKYESELKDLEFSEREATTKYLEIKNKCLQLEDTIITLQGNLRQVEQQLESSQEISEKLNNEKTKMREIVREELKNEIFALEKEVTILRNDRDKELQQIYARVRVAISKKDDMLEELSRNHKALQEKCIYLESMMEQQKKEYLIK